MSYILIEKAGKELFYILVVEAWILIHISDINLIFMKMYKILTGDGLDRVGSGGGQCRRVVPA